LGLCLCCQATDYGRARADTSQEQGKRLHNEIYTVKSIKAQIGCQHRVRSSPKMDANNGEWFSKINQRPEKLTCWGNRQKCANIDTQIVARKEEE